MSCYNQTPWAPPGTRVTILNMLDLPLTIINVENFLSQRLVHSKSPVNQHYIPLMQNIQLINPFIRPSKLQMYSSTPIGTSAYNPHSLHNIVMHWSSSLTSSNMMVCQFWGWKISPNIYECTHQLWGWFPGNHSPTNMSLTWTHKELLP